jgi:NADPH-dependent ferric siderophore reductase
MAATRLTVTSTQWITPSLRRLWFHSDDLSEFAGSEHADRYVKLVFPKPGVELPEPLDLRALRGQLAAEDMPTVRTYTALFPDVDAGTVAIDFVIHGDEGVAGRWAAGAEPGDQLLANGPGGAYIPDPSADWHLLVGDESALPAITAALAVLADRPGTVPVRVVALVGSPEHQPALALPDGAEVTWVHRSAGGSLEDVVRALEWLPGRVHAFVHGEASMIMHGIRPYLLRERRLGRAQVSISGYWRHGRTEEGFRAWKSEQAATESR